jgi:hypothetical protein
MVMHGYKWILISSHWDFNHLIWGFAISPLNSSLIVATCSVSEYFFLPSSVDKKNHIDHTAPSFAVF